MMVRFVSAGGFICKSWIENPPRIGDEFRMEKIEGTVSKVTWVIDPKKKQNSGGQMNSVEVYIIEYDRSDLNDQI